MFHVTRAIASGCVPPLRAAISGGGERCRRLLSRETTALGLALGAAAIASAPTRTEEEAKEDITEPIPGVKPFVALFLNDESKSRLKKRFPESAGCRSASYVVVEPTEVTTDKTVPDVLAPLMGEKGKFVVEWKKSEGDLTVLRGKFFIGKHETDKDYGGCSPSLTFGGESDDEVAHQGARMEDSDEFKILKKPLKLTGTICRADYWDGKKCTLEPLYECPLCAYMKQSPCKEPFTAWEDCLNASDALGGTDEERSARFISRCKMETLALKECVDKYPEFFGNMFGGGAEAAESSSSSPPKDGEVDSDKKDQADEAATSPPPSTPSSSSSSSPEEVPPPSSVSST